MIRRTLLLIFTISIAINLKAQTINGNIDIDDSHKAGSSKGDGGPNIINVDQYTGTASVGIPIYDYSTDGLGLGVSLGYTAKGIRVDELASPVGLGWGLSAGGTITRQIAGIEDEVTMPVYFNTTSSTHDTLQGLLVPGAKPFNDSAIGFNDDHQNDIFNFNAGGLSFSFSINRSGQILTYPKTTVKIEIITKDSASSGGGFTNIRQGIQQKTGLDEDHDIMTFLVTDEQGNKFYFERGDYQKKKVKGPHLTYQVDSAEYYSTSSWILDKIITYSGKEIKYYYTHKHMVYVQDVTEVLTNKTYQYVLDTASPTGVTFTYDPLEITEQKFDGEAFHLNKIEYPNGAVLTFELGSDANDRCDCQGNFVVKSIKIEKKHGVEDISNHLKFKFNYAYFNSNNYGQTIYPELAYPTPCSTIANSLTIPSGEDTASAKAMHLSRGLRLKLKSIERIGNDDTTKEPYYTFDYNSTRLPYRFSPSKDYYGYFNNETCTPYVRQNYLNVLNGNNALPDQTYYLSIPYHADPNDTSKHWGVKRNHNFTYAQACVLNKIQNAMHGVKQLVFKDYHLSNPDSSYGWFSAPHYDIDIELEGDTVNDGLCIWKIISTDEFSSQHTATTEYSYSGGERFHRGGYCWYPDGNGNKVFTNFFVNPNEYVNGSNHGFSEVTVTVNGINNDYFSKTKTTYSNLMYFDENGHHVSCIHKPTGISCHNMGADMMKYRMGLTMKTELYDENNSLRTKTENAYTYFTYGPQIQSTYSFEGPVDFAFAYDIINHEMMRLTGAVTTRYVYDPAVSTTKTLTSSYSYKYDDNNRLKVYTWADSRNDTFKKFRYYSDDYEGKYGYVISLDSMNKHHMYHVLSNEVWKMTAGDSVLLNYTLAAPKFNSDNTLTFPAAFQSITKDPLPSSAVFPATGPYRSIDRYKALKFESNTSYGSNLLKAKLFTLYDDIGNVLETKLNDQDMYESAIWDKESDAKIAEVSNARYEDIAYSSFEGKYANKGVADYNKGNWDFDGNDIISKSNAACSSAMTGHYVLDLYGTSKEIVSKPLKHKKYVFSFWLSAYTDAAVTLDNGGSSSSVTCTVQNTVGNWKLYTAAIEPDSGWHLTIHGVPPPFVSQPNSYAYLDDLRLHPANASMVSHTSEPMFGINSMTSPQNYITYLEYDQFGRKVIIRDMRGYIVKKYETRFYDLDGAEANNGSEGTPGGGQ